MTQPLTQQQVIKLAHAAIDKQELPEIYHQRLDFEFAEIDKQGAWLYWLDLINQNKRFSSNPAKLLLPWVLQMLVVQQDGQWRRLTKEERAAADPIAARNQDKDGRILCTAHYKAVGQEMERLGGKLPVDIQLDADKPDIDLDCLPEARDKIKAYAAEQYQGKMDEEQATYGYVCPVGTWQTYKLRSALVDCYKAHGHTDKAEILQLTTSLPDDVDEMPDGGYSTCKGKDKATGTECKEVHNQAECPKCHSTDTKAPTIGKLLLQYPQLQELKDKLPMVVEHAVGIVGRIRNMGMHAGAIIIADRPLYGNLPLVARRSGDKDDDQKVQWISSWTEGRNTQLSKFGYIKWDILGLKNLKYLLTCCELIKQNRGVSFGDKLEGWELSDPLANVAGWYEQDGVRHIIPLDDKAALALADRQETDGIFQFDTQLAKQILSNGVRTFYDLLLFNAMGHPGPMDSIPEAVANRDSTDASWRQKLKDLDPVFLEVLGDTYGTIVFQEQLATIWQRIGGFTAPEAQDARKAVAKKWKEQLEPIREKWLKGAAPRIGLELAEEWWKKMEDFGRYAFNKSHAVAYCLVAYKCLWLKAHFPAEWWAAVMTDCHPEKLIRYIATAKSERDPGTGEPRVGIAPLNIANLTYSFTVTGNDINQGLIGVKGIGEKAARRFEGRGNYESVDDFVAQKGVSRSVMERLIKLGSFGDLPDHQNRRCLWYWYVYKYAKDINSVVDKHLPPAQQMTVKHLRRLIDELIARKLGWDDKYILQEKRKLIAEYARQFPNRKKVPEKLQFWKPTLNHLSDAEARQLVLDNLLPDYSSVEILDFERQYIGYYLTNCMERFHYDGSCSIAAAKETDNGVGIIHAIVTKIEEGQTKKAREAKATEPDMCKLYLSDGQDEALVFVWSEDMVKYRELLDEITFSLSKTGRAQRAEVGLAVVVRWAALRKSFSLYQKSKYGRSNYEGPTLVKLELAKQCSSPLEMVSPAISAQLRTATALRTTA